MQFLLQKAKFLNLDLNAQDEFGGSAFHSACGHGYLQIVKHLIKNSKDLKIELNAKDDWQRTAYHYASYFHRMDIVKVIQANSEYYKIDTNSKDCCGFTGMEMSETHQNPLKSIFKIRKYLIHMLGSDNKI